jgi:uncharacterized protein (TIGR03435 family)
MTVDRTSDGIQIDLKTGDIIVTAAKQRDGQLSVRTNDMTVAVEGTVFLANAGAAGSRVAVIEGEVRVREGAVETRLRPGEEVATSPAVARRSLAEDITWSRNADVHLAILESFKRGIAQTSGPPSVVVPAAEQQQGTSPASPAAVEFEEASIRACDPDNLPSPPAGARSGGANSFQMTPGRTYGLCLTLATLIRTAYGFRPPNPFDPEGRGSPPMRFDSVYGLGVEDGRRVRGGPDWVHRERYTIDAVAAGQADAQTMRGPMLRALLERRFGLKVHIETEQIRAFELTVAPGGLEMKEGTCSHTPGVGRGSAMGWRTNIDAARRGETTTDPCGLGFLVNGPNMLFIGAGTGVPLFVEVVDAPVFNRTGIPDSARFNFVLEYLPDDRLGHLGQIPPGGGAMALQIASDPASVPRAPDFFTALEHQLGLKLAPARAPNEFIVIDHVERPSPN